MEMRKELKRILSLEENLKPDGSSYKIDQDGLRIYTTIDPQIQRHAEESMINHMKGLQKTFDRHWNMVKPDPWHYDEDKSDVTIKLNNLKSQVRQSSRYSSMHEKIWKPILMEYEQNADRVITDNDIFRMLEEEEPEYEGRRLYAVSPGQRSTILAGR